MEEHISWCLSDPPTRFLDEPDISRKVSWFTYSESLLRYAIRKLNHARAELKQLKDMAEATE